MAAHFDAEERRGYENYLRGIAPLLAATPEARQGDAEFSPIASLWLAVVEQAFTDLRQFANKSLLLGSWPKRELRTGAGYLRHHKLELRKLKGWFARPGSADTPGTLAWCANFAPDPQGFLTRSRAKALDFLAKSIVASEWR